MITYFIRGANAVKIGRTSNLQSRVNQLQTSCHAKMKVLKVSDIDEKTAHTIAGSLSKRMHGEWFEVNEDLIEWISTVPSSSNEEAMRLVKVGGRPKGITKEKVNFTINMKIMQDFKAATESRGCSMSSAVESLMRGYISDREMAIAKNLNSEGGAA